MATNNKLIIVPIGMDEWYRENRGILMTELESVARELLIEQGVVPGGAYKIEPSEARKDRPIVNITADDEDGWKEHYQGGPLTKIAAKRKRFSGSITQKKAT